MEIPCQIYRGSPLGVRGLPPKSQLEFDPFATLDPGDIKSRQHVVVTGVLYSVSILCLCAMTAGSVWFEARFGCAIRTAKGLYFFALGNHRYVAARHTDRCSRYHHTDVP
jgi:hypothetical protein